MGFETPKLDDRSFRDLVDEARRRIPLYCPEWTDHNLSDPGITLIELFAWMTDIVLYRLNRVPDKMYVKFMEMIGIRMQEAEPARVPVTFWLTVPQANDITIPDGTEVSTVRTDTDPAIVFSTDVPVEIYVPKLAHVLTSSTGRTGQREFKSYEARRVLGGNESFLAFESKPPKQGDAFYIGFEQDLSHHILGIQISVARAEGAGIDPNNPPYVWEVMGVDAEQNWMPVALDMDGTLGLNTPGLVRIHLPKLSKGTRGGVTAFWVRCRLDPTRSQRTYGVSPTITQMSIASWGITIESTNVTRIKNEILGRSDGTPGQRFFLAHTPVVPRIKSQEYIIVRRDDGRDERWAEVADFSSSLPDDKHYTLDGSTGEIHFGPALPQRDGSIQCFGAMPPKNAMIVMRAYRFGGGQQGNLAAETITIMKSNIPYIARVTNRIAARGGLDAEKLDTAKQRVPGFLRSLDRAVTAQDFAYLAEEAAPGMVSRAFCLQPPTTARGEIKVLIIPRIKSPEGYIAPESLSLSQDLRDIIFAYLDERRMLATQLDVLPPSYQFVETDVRIRVLPSAPAEETRQKAEDKLYNFLNPITGGHDGKGWPFGRDLNIGDIMAALLAVPGVESVRAAALYPATYERGSFTRGEALAVLPLPPQGIVASATHDVRIE
ncbi:MAG: putative baseplate assembly protein [Pleurocapsa minor GSE-CHR-MK-17-07R]|jgi:predicted phage baseplate assembly protein|nr:putative baseplate assembly protein [Pleurocapsa minor GSE-CHR-MK 17-07R]